MKLLKVIKKTIIVILYVVFFSFAIFMAILLASFNDFGVTQMGDTSVVIIKKEIASDNYKKWDVVLVGKKEVNELSVGDEVFAYKLGKNNSVSIDLGIIDGIFPGSGSQDDLVTFENGVTYSMEYVIGKSTKVYNDVGKYLSVIESKWGFLFIILVPSFLIFVYQLYALIIEIKYGKDEGVSHNTN